MEKRNFIFKDHTGNTIRKVLHDSSILKSLPRPGDEIYDISSDITNPISGLVQRIQFDYIHNIINVYIKID